MAAIGGHGRVESLLSGKGLRLLIVTGDEQLVQELYAYLEPLGYVLDSASNGIAGWQRASTGSYDIIILDVMLPGMDGLTLCRRLREESGNETPVLMLTSGESLENRVLCLNWGADDFVTKPVAMLELEARLRAVVRRAKAQQVSRLLRWAGLELDPQTHTITCEGRPMHLRPICFTLLARLMRSAPGIVTREDLEHEIYGDSPPDSDSLRTHIHMLRRALEKAGRPILKTVTHVGFRLEPWENAQG